MKPKTLEDFLPLFRILARKYNPQDFDDLVSCACVGYYEAKKKYDGIHNFKSYVMQTAQHHMFMFFENNTIIRVCRNTHLKYRYKKYDEDSFKYQSVRMAKNVMMGDGNLEPLDITDIEEECATKEIVGHINTAKRKLSDRLREIIRLKYEEGLTGTEIANKLGESRQRIHQLENDALEILKEEVLPVC